MYAGAKKCIRQTLGWTAYVDDGWKDVDVTFTCAGGNPSEEYRILTTLTGAIVVIMVMTRAKGNQILFFITRPANSRRNHGSDNQVR